MKLKLLLFIMLLLFIAMPLSISFAQEPGTVFFGGINYDEAAVVVTGVGFNIPGTGLWNWSYSNFGAYSSINNEVSYLVRFDKLYIGPIIGPNIDWQEPAEDVGIITYLSGAAGLMGGVSFTEKFGIWAYGKYKFDFKEEDQSMYIDGYAVGGGLFIKF